MVGAVMNSTTVFTVLLLWGVRQCEHAAPPPAGHCRLVFQVNLGRLGGRVPSRPPVPAGWTNEPQCPVTARFNCLSFSSNGKPQSCWCGIQTTACVGVQGLQGVTDCGLTGSATSLHLSFSNRCILAYCQWYLAVQLVAATASAFTPNRMRRSLHGETVWERVAATQKDETHRALNRLN